MSQQVIKFACLPFGPVRSLRTLCDGPYVVSLDSVTFPRANVINIKYGCHAEQVQIQRQAYKSPCWRAYLGNSAPVQGSLSPVARSASSRFPAAGSDSLPSLQAPDSSQMVP
jgi:hypothetical protein